MWCGVLVDILHACEWLNSLISDWLLITQTALSDEIVITSDEAQDIANNAYELALNVTKAPEELSQKLEDLKDRWELSSIVRGYEFLVVRGKSMSEVMNFLLFKKINNYFSLHFISFPGLNCGACIACPQSYWILRELTQLLLGDVFCQFIMAKDSCLAFLTNHTPQPNMDFSSSQLFYQK